MAQNMVGEFSTKQNHERLEQLAGWLQLQGLEPGTSAQDQLFVLWQALQQRERKLVVMTTEMDARRLLKQVRDQSLHMGEAQHHSPWKRLFGNGKSGQSKNKSIQGFLDEQELAQQLLGSKNEICDLLRSLDREKSLCHKLQLKYEDRLHRAQQKLGAETKWRHERLDSLERALSLSNYSLLKNKEFIVTIMAANEKLMFEKRQLLEQLNVEELNTGCMFTSSLADRSGVPRKRTENIQCSDDKQTEVTSYPDSPLGRAQPGPPEMGCKSLTAGGSCSKHPAISQSQYSSADVHMM